MATGLDVARDHPAYQLRERLMRGVDAPVGTREGQLERFALMIKSWNLWAKGETVTDQPPSSDPHKMSVGGGI